MNVYSRPFYQYTPAKTNSALLTFGNQESDEDRIQQETNALCTEIFEVEPLRNTKQSIEKYLDLFEKSRLFLAQDSVVCRRSEFDGQHTGVRLSNDKGAYAEIGYTFEQTKHSPWEKWESDIHSETGNEQQAGRRPVFYIMARQPGDVRARKVIDGKGLITAAETIRDEAYTKDVAIRTLYRSDLAASVIDHRRKQL